MTIRTAIISKNSDPVSKSKPHKTKKARLIIRLSTKKGASIKSLCTDFGWQPHTVRAALSGLRSAGHEIERASSRNGTIYKIVRNLNA